WPILTRSKPNTKPAPRSAQILGWLRLFWRVAIAIAQQFSLMWRTWDRQEAEFRLLLVNQIALTELLEFKQVILPVEGYAVRIFTVGERVIDRLVGQDIGHLFQTELLRIKLRQC